MGGSQSKTESSFDRQRVQTTAAPTTTAPCPCDYPKKELHLALAFLAGILLALLLMAIVLLIIKSYRKCHSSPQAVNPPHSDSLSKFSSTPEKALTSASMDLNVLEETRDPCRANHSADSNSVVYAQIRVLTSSP